MSQRELKIFSLRDLVEHLAQSQKQLEWTDDPGMIRVITESILRDLESCRRLCEELHRKAQVRQAV
jgi:hypothetical protein